MRYLILSDIHSNLEALNAVLERAKQHGYDKLLCIGDVVGYAANPNEVCEILKNMSGIFVLGNHEAGILDITTLDWFNENAQEAVVWAGRMLKPENLEFIKTFKEVYDTSFFIAVHGSLTKTCWDYVHTEEEARACFDLLQHRVCFVGHSHWAGAFFKKENMNVISHMDFYEGGKITFTNDFKYIVNCGSVGQPRDRNPDASFGIFDDEAKTVEVFRVPYDFKITQEKILAAGLPANLAYRLSMGR